MQAESAASQFALDVQGLQRLKQGAREQDPEALRAAAQQFEALFLHSMIKGMRATVPTSDLTNSKQTEFYQSLLDHQWAQTMAERGIGLADQLVEQLESGQRRPSAVTTPQAAAAATAALDQNDLLAHIPRGEPRMLKTLPDQRQSAEAEKAPASPNPVGSTAASPDQDRPIADRPPSVLAAQTPLAGGRYALFEPAATAPLIERSGAQPSSGLLEPEGDASRNLASHRAELTAGHQTTQATGGSADYWAPSPGGLLDALSGSLDPRPANLSAMTTADVRDQPAHVQAFLQPLLAPAQAASRKTGVPAELILAQAALETGWGRHQIRTDDGRNSHNLFGIKAGSHWQGATAAVTTHEYYNGQRTRIKDQFRVYDSYEAACTDYGRLISRSPRYAAVGTAPNAEQAARALQAGGYATDPAYADKLIKIMGHFDAVAAEAERSPLIQGF